MTAVEWRQVAAPQGGWVAVHLEVVGRGIHVAFDISDLLIPRVDLILVAWLIALHTQCSLQGLQ